MNRYGKYFLQHSLWLDDGFCRYYVQDDTWGRPEILDVPHVIFDWSEDAEQWLRQCADHDWFWTHRQMRVFLSDFCLEPFLLHRMNDRRVMRPAARQICRYSLRVVIEPRLGWAVMIDAHSGEPLIPPCIEPEPELDGLLAELRAELDALVAGQQGRWCVGGKL